MILPIDPSVVDSNGCNVFHNAAFYYPDTRELISFFFHWDADINQKNSEGKTQLSCVLVYVEFGADISMKGVNSGTLIHTMFNNPNILNYDGYLYLIKLLIDFILDLNAKNSTPSKMIWIA